MATTLKETDGLEETDATLELRTCNAQVVSFAEQVELLMSEGYTRGEATEILQKQRGRSYRNEQAARG